MTMLCKTVFRFNTVPIKLPMVFFEELEQNISQLVWKYKRPWKAKEILRKKKRSVGFTLPDLYVTSSVEQDRKPRGKPKDL